MRVYNPSQIARAVIEERVEPCHECAVLGRRLPLSEKVLRKAVKISHSVDKPRPLPGPHEAPQCSVVVLPYGARAIEEQNHRVVWSRARRAQPLVTGHHSDTYVKEKRGSPGLTET